MRTLFIIFFCFCCTKCFSQDSTYIKVHFLYGSKPLKQYRDTEPKWFGGMLGGHVGIEGDTNSIVNFLPSGKFHWFAKQRNRHSKYALHDSNSFYGMLGGRADSVKKAIVYIPVSFAQKQKFDSISSAYLKQTPYDYALFGMRCGAAAYDILAQIQLLPAYGYKKTYRKVFYPEKLRSKLFQISRKNNWLVTTSPGASTRKWEAN